MVGGKFQVSNSADFSKVATLFTLTAVPAGGKLSAKPVAPAQAFRYVRYLAPDGTFGDIAEIAFIGF